MARTCVNSVKHPRVETVLEAIQRHEDVVQHTHARVQWWGWRGVHDVTKTDNI